MSIEIDVEDVQERILEILQNSLAIQHLVDQEYQQRFAGMGIPETMATEDLRNELYCVCQLLTWRRILGEIA